MLTGENYIKQTVIGLTGFYCSGKSEVEKILKNKFHYYMIDVDKTGHWALEKKKKELIKFFNSKIIIKNKIDRKILGQIVFNDKLKLKKLNSIVHPEMIKKVKDEIKKNKNKPVCINAALLFDMGLDKLCNKIIFVKSTLIKIVIRAIKRDNSSIFRTLKILSYQNKLISIKNKNVFYLKNNSTLSSLAEKIKNII